MLNLSGKNALVTGIANNRSIAWGIAQQLHKAGANLGITYLPDDKGKMEKKVAELVNRSTLVCFCPAMSKMTSKFNLLLQLSGKNGEN